ncbi:Similar to similar to ankyrin repeat domain-containing protein 29 [Botryotinia fuckeliana]; acc. no. CCD47337 [Pyronema omphalodes CBS 100304]|uniref:Similar to similar to ankyrin repeat domain-containing protein 29 [Botryotinia fuckeliana] acc. no. CCD47337 n=1 Tax=Pyronema omphalodes (strain CBS 100304) TaxID=1076935 RepID=U4KWZ3_PYROM|nr:Similar to similar to ankyrin repeat domain-containing protein 29 [Botryotinia fuckeliana]; acc. no. CCD47337 [Pyronema omphalodes CBS 100304]
MRQTNNVPQALVDYYDRAVRRCQNNLVFDELCRVFATIIQDFQSIYIIFDAPDECEEHRDREKLLLFLKALVHQEDQGCCIKLFITSRREADTEKAFKSTCNLVEVSAKRQQIYQQLRFESDQSKTREWGAHTTRGIFKE